MYESVKNKLTIKIQKTEETRRVSLTDQVSNRAKQKHEGCNFSEGFITDI